MNQTFQAEEFSIESLTNISFVIDNSKISAQDYLKPHILKAVTNPSQNDEQYKHGCHNQ